MDTFPECKRPCDNIEGVTEIVEHLATICMKTEDNKVLTGWLASQTDMFADDWVIVE